MSKGEPQLRWGRNGKGEAERRQKSENEEWRGLRGGLLGPFGPPFCLELKALRFQVPTEQLNGKKNQQINPGGSARHSLALTVL